MSGPTEMPTLDAAHCYRHPGRETLLSCSNCERPICTSCMTQAAVGVRCPECARGGGSAAKAVTRRLGSRVGAGAVRRGSDMAYATGTLIALNVVFYFAQMTQALSFGGATNSQLVVDGAVYGPAIADGEWWRLITGGFLHASIIHIGFNMYLLWILGGALERYAGMARMLAIYFAAVLWGSVGALALEPNALTIGASGGVFGLMAALYLLERQRGMSLLGGSVGGLLLLNLGITFLLPGISIGGHIGGIVGGAAAGFALSGFGRGHLAYGRDTPMVWGAVGAIIVGAFAVGILIA